MDIEREKVRVVAVRGRRAAEHEQRSQLTMGSRQKWLGVGRRKEHI
jgi:hypothetical protein